MTWSTPRVANNRNALKNHFLQSVSVQSNMDARVNIEIPGKTMYQAALLGWDDYTLVLRTQSGRLQLVWQGPGLRVSPVGEDFLSPGSGEKEG